jgi:two-component system, sensor histidine kinase LadS
MSKLPLVRCVKHLLLGSLLGLAGPWTFAQSPAATATPAAEVAAVTLLHTLALIAPAQQPIEAVQAIPSQGWQAFNPNTSYPTKDGLALWVQLKLSINKPENGWSIKLPKPYLDQVELHLPSGSGTWTVQAAGDHIAQTSWPIHGLHPQFSLPNLAAGTTTVFVKITSAVPVSFRLEVLSQKQAQTNNLDHLLRSGLVLALMLSMAFISACLALIYRDKAYAYYSIYALLAIMTAASYSGWGGYLLWPEATRWPERSTDVSLLLCLIAQMVFCYATFSPQKMYSMFTPLAWAAAALTTVCTGIVLACDDVSVRAIAFFLGMLINWPVIIAMVYVRLREGDLSAKLWILAYLPLCATIVASAFEYYGLTSQTIVGFYWVMYSLALEVPVLLLALLLRAQQRDAQQVAWSVRQQLDPLTGFIVPRVYPQTAAPIWEKSAALNLELVVVYLQVTQPDAPSAFFTGSGTALSSERAVRVLRTVFGSEDIYAKVTKNVYAVLMPGKSLDDAMKNRLARLVAQVHMINPELKTDYPLRARVMVCGKAHPHISWPEVHTALLDKFDHAKGWDKRSIRYLFKRSRQQESDSDLSKFWTNAVEISTELTASSSPSGR